MAPRGGSTCSGVGVGVGVGVGHSRRRRARMHAHMLGLQLAAAWGWQPGAAWGRQLGGCEPASEEEGEPLVPVLGVAREREALAPRLPAAALTWLG